MNTPALALLHTADPCQSQRMQAALLVAEDSDGTFTVDLGGAVLVRCQWLQTGAESPTLAPGDRLAVVDLGTVGWVALGRIGPYAAPRPRDHLVLQAAKSVALRCGESSLTLHADGKVLLKGDDVVVHAKGTQRIRAGHVAIN